MTPQGNRVVASISFSKIHVQGGMYYWFSSPFTYPALLYNVLYDMAINTCNVVMLEIISPEGDLYPSAVFMMANGGCQQQGPINKHATLLGDWALLLTSLLGLWQQQGPITKQGCMLVTQ